MDDEKPLKTVWITASPPFEFGISTAGELMISWVHGHLETGEPLRFGVLVPASELPKLKLGLKLSDGIPELLSTKPPPQGAH